MRKKILFGLLLLVVLTVLLWGFLTNWKFTCRRSDSNSTKPVPCPVPVPVPKYPGISVPANPKDSQEKADAIKQYVLGNYPAMDPKSYHPDFWKSLDFIWNMTCYTKKSGTAYFPNPQKSDQGNPVFRYILQQFQLAITNQAPLASWLTFTPSLDSLQDNLKTAGFTYSPNPESTRVGSSNILMLYDAILFPLCSWHMNSDLPSKINGVMINRYPPGHGRTKALAYAAKDTANDIVTHEVIPGVDLVVLNKGFRSNSNVEVMHCDTHLTAMATSLDCLNSCDLLANTCASHGPPGVGFGKWVYYARGSGLWVNLGNTLVFRSKIDAVMGTVNLWDGKDSRDSSPFVNNNYKGTLRGKFSDSTSLDTWQRFVADEDGTVKLALQSLLTGSCLTPASPTSKFPAKPSTAKIDMTDSNVPKCNGSLDPLGLGGDQYSGPCSPKAGYCDATKTSNDVVLWWFWSTDTAQGDWGLFSPLVPLKYTTDADKCGWILWASVNGYDFAKNPENYTWSQAVTKKYLSGDLDKNSAILNSFLSSMSNSGYSTDDFIINYANYAKIDSVQLTTNSAVGNITDFEILLFSGTVDKTQAGYDPKNWICDNVNPNANMQCIGSSSEKSDWLGGSSSVFFSADPLNAMAPTDPKTEFLPIITPKSCGDAGYYLKNGYVNYSDNNGVGFPLLHDTTLNECSN